jgi:hypothetical protein
MKLFDAAVAQNSDCTDTLPMAIQLAHLFACQGKHDGDAMLLTPVIKQCTYGIYWYWYSSPAIRLLAALQGQQPKQSVDTEVLKQCTHGTHQFWEDEGGHTTEVSCGRVIPLVILIYASSLACLHAAMYCTRSVQLHLKHHSQVDDLLYVVIQATHD